MVFDSQDAMLSSAGPEVRPITVVNMGHWLWLPVVGHFQNATEQVSRHGGLDHLEDDVAAVVHYLRTDRHVHWWLRLSKKPGRNGVPVSDFGPI